MSKKPRHLNDQGTEARQENVHERDFALEMTVPPLGAVFFKPGA